MIFWQIRTYSYKFSRTKLRAYTTKIPKISEIKNNIHIVHFGYCEYRLIK